MKRIAIAALAASLIGGAALAEPRHGGNDGGHQSPSGNFHGSQNVQRGPGGSPGGSNRFHGNPGFQGPNQNNFHAQNNFHGQTGGPAPTFRGGPGAHDQRFTRGGDDRGADAHFNGGRNNGDFRGDRDWHGGRWGGPHDSWGYHGWGYGAFIPRAFLVDSFFLADFADYDLGPPPPNCEWVQDGPNALLIDIYTGRVIEVIPNAFY